MWMRRHHFLETVPHHEEDDFVSPASDIGVGNAVLFYRVLDLAVTETYRGDEISRRSRQAADAQKLLSLLMQHASRADLLSAAQRAGLEVLHKGKEELYVGDLHFVLSGDRVAAVRLD